MKRNHDGNCVKANKGLEKGVVVGSRLYGQDPEYPTPKVSFGASLYSFMDGVSMVGPKYVVMSSSSFGRRIIWAILVFAGLGFLIYQVYDRMAYFQQSPVRITRTVNYPESVRFPTVTICNENRISLSRTYRLLGTVTSNYVVVYLFIRKIISCYQDNPVCTDLFFFLS